jgi:hypothetical protein
MRLQAHTASRGDRSAIPIPRYAAFAFPLYDLMQRFTKTAFIA